MNIEYRDYVIQIKAKQKKGLWAAYIRVWPRKPTIIALRARGEVEERNREGEAKEAGRYWVNYRLTHTRTNSSTDVILYEFLILSLELLRNFPNLKTLFFLEHRSTAPST